MVRLRLLVFAEPGLRVYCAKLRAVAREGGIGPGGIRRRDAGFCTRELAGGKTALPELSITRGKHKVLIRMAHYFLRERHIGDCPLRFDVVAIDNSPGRLPVVRLHRDALSPRT
jgi:hypothetical protein